MGDLEHCETSCINTCQRQAELADFFKKSQAIGRVTILPDELREQANDLDNNCLYAHGFIDIHVELEEPL